MLSRREWFGTTLGASAALALTPELRRALSVLAQTDGTLIQRAIPSTGELLPAVGLSFSNHVSCADPAALKAVLKAFADNGGRVFDAMHGNAAAENFHINAAGELGVRQKLFWSVRGFAPAPGGPSQPTAEGAKAQISSLLERLNVSKLDLAMVNPGSGTAHLDVLKAEKKAGRIRYIGAQVISDNLYPQLEAVMRNEPIDFIGVDYDVGNRARVEDTILPLALERKIGVMAFFPLGANAGTSCGALSRNLFARVGTTPLPEWAAEFDARTWAQFFLKYVISHPAVTVARVGTTKTAHMIDNIGGGIGRLPDEATRKRMAAFIDALPALPPLPQNPAAAPGIAVSSAILKRYVGQYAAASGFTATFRLDGDRLWVKPGTNPEAPLNARSETRFQDPRGPMFEFQLDSKGEVTGAVLEQQGPQGPSRVRLVRK